VVQLTAAPQIGSNLNGRISKFGIQCWNRLLLHLLRPDFFLDPRFDGENLPPL